MPHRNVLNLITVRERLRVQLYRIHSVRSQNREQSAPARQAFPSASSVRIDETIGDRLYPNCNGSGAPPQDAESAPIQRERRFEHRLRKKAAAQGHVPEAALPLARAAPAAPMDRIQRLFQAQQQAQNGGGPAADSPAVDTAELVYISSMALLKMLKHGRAGVPMEVMGLMLGDFVDDYTIKCVDVFAMPQSGTGVSVEAVDPVFQTKMLDMLKQTGRPEMVVGWYHSHPGFGCWLSGVDVNTQQSFEALNQRAVAVVVDPIQSVKGKVVIDCFRSINPQMIMLGQEPRQTTSNVGHLNKPSIQALIHGLNRHYYSIALSYRKNDLEQKMLQNLHKKNWTAGLTLDNYDTHAEETRATVKEMVKLSAAYEKAVKQETELSSEQLVVATVGKMDAKKRISEAMQRLMSANIVQALGTMLDTVVF